MPSSTSSSEPSDAFARAPEDGTRQLLVGLVIGLLLVAGAEVFWRSRGMRPSVPDTASHWAAAVDRALAQGRRSVAILGSSRAILGLDPAVAEAEHPDIAVSQLAIYGSSPLEVLRFLAEDQDFAGLALVEIGPIAFLDSAGATDALPRRWVRAFDSRPLYSDIEVECRARLHELLASRRPSLTPLEILKNWRATGGLPRPDHLVVAANRHMRADFRAADLERMIADRLRSARENLRARSPAERDAFFATLRDLVGRVTARGGRVVFLCMPVDGSTRALDERLAPRREYWDRLATLPGAAAIHHADEAELAAFRTGDGSHLDRRDAPAFTRALFRILAGRNLLPRGER